jgi:hypothetical protein
MSQIRKYGLWTILGAVILVGVVSFILYNLNQNTIVPASWGSEAGTRSSTADWLNALQQALLTPGVAAVLGTLILRRYPRHRMGWLLIIISLSSIAMLFFAELTVYSYFTAATPVPGAEWIAWFNNWLWVVLFTILLYMLAVFPTGHFVSNRWRLFLSAMLAWFALPLIAGTAIEPTMTSSFQIPNPLCLNNCSRGLFDILFYSGLPAMPLTAFALVMSTIVRYRRGQGRERHQMKWLLGGVGLLALMVLIGIFLSLVGSTVGEIIVNASILGPISGIGVALLRHQLFDIDIIIRRTLVYALVSALLALIYFGSVVVLQALVTAVGGQQSGVVVAVSTLVIAGLFNPVRKRVQIVVDRRFFRQKYNAAQILNRFAAAARDEVDMNNLTAALVETVQETMYPEQISLWLKSEPKPTARNGFS